MKINFFSTIRGKFLLITVITATIIAIGTSSLSYYMFSQNLKDNMIHAAETNLHLLRNEINGYLDEVNELTQWCRNNEYILNYIKTPQTRDSYSILANSAQERLTEAYISKSVSPYISRIVIANTDNTKYLQRISSTIYSNDKDMVKIIKELPYYQELLDAPKYTFSIGVQQDPFINYKEIMLPIIRPIYSPYNNDVIGFCYLQLSMNMFIEPLEEYSAQENVPVYLVIEDETYKIQKGSMELMTSKPEMVPIEIDNLITKNTQVNETIGDSENIIYVSSPLDADNCYISIPVIPNEHAATIPGFSVTLAAILILVFLICAVLYYFLLHTIGEPVKILKTHLQYVAQGNFEHNPEIEWKNEFGEIGQNINLLATDINNLMEQRITYEKQKKDYEYMMLQSQINPHFLYNTLNSIKWMAVAQRATGISEMTTALAHLLKSISKGTTTLVSIRDELALLNDYFTIQKYRYGGTITMDYHIEDDSLLENQILRFTLQPIVENAIFHGIEPKGQSGQILVHIYQKSFDTVSIDITDNGVGMSPEAIQQILESDDTEHSSFFKQIGISSVNKRIQYNFGEQYKLSIDSVVGEYTTMKITLPAQTLPKGDLHNDKIVDC